MNECRGESLTRMRGPMSHVTRSILAMSLAVVAAIALTASASAQQAAPAPATPAKPTPPKPAAPKPPQAAAKPKPKPAPTAPAAAAPEAPAAPAVGGVQPTLLGTFGDWGAYTASPAGKKVCFALAKPANSQTTPPGRPRDPAFLFVSSRPAEKVKDEVSL